MKIFLISYTGRCGSTWLTRALATDPSVINHQEAFSFTNANRLPPVGDIDHALDRVDELYQPDMVNIYKVFYNQVGYIHELLELPDAVPVLIHRPNALAQYSSHEIAHRTKIWHTGVKTKQTLIPFERQPVIANYNGARNMRVGMSMMYPDLHTVSYETMHADTHELATALGLSIDLSRIPVKTIKTNTPSIIDRFDPWDHPRIHHMLNTINKNNWLEEITDIP